MKKELFQGNVIVKKSKAIHGYGVFATKNFKKGDPIEECYLLVSTKGGDKALEDYYFQVGRSANGIPLGFGMIYNHAEDPNADYKIYRKRSLMVFKASRAIKKGEEIFISYGDEGWFNDRKMKLKSA